MDLFLGPGAISLAIARDFARVRDAAPGPFPFFYLMRFLVDFSRGVVYNVVHMEFWA